MHTFSFSLYLISNLPKYHTNSHFVFTWTQIVNILPHLSFALSPPIALSLHTQFHSSVHWERVGTVTTQWQ